MPALVVGIFLGGRSENGQFGNFNGSRPLTDSQIANAVLTSATVSVVASALIWAAVMAAAVWILEQRTGLPLLQRVIRQFESIRGLEVVTLGIRLLGFATLVIGAIWGAVGLMTSLFLGGKKVSGVVVCTMFGWWIGGNIVMRYLPSHGVPANFDHVFRFAFIVFPQVCIAAAFAAGWWLKLISRNTLVVAAAIVAAPFAGAHLTGITSEPGSILPVLWLCRLTPSALAAAPLAVWWNRHR